MNCLLLVTMKGEQTKYSNLRILFFPPFHTSPALSEKNTNYENSIKENVEEKDKKKKRLFL